MKQTVAAYIAKTLEQAGVKRIWGVTGDSLNGLSDSLNRMGTIDWMPTRHEEVAAFAAGAEAQLTGELAVCAGSCGPGNLHLINGLFDCHRNHVPVLAIAAHIPSSEIGSGAWYQWLLALSGAAFSATSPGSTTTETPRLITALRMAMASTCGICSGVETSSQ